MKRLEQEIMDAIAEETGIDRSEIKLDSDLYDLGIDSLSALELLVILESKYDIRIPETKLKDTNIIGDIIKIIAREINKKINANGN